MSLANGLWKPVSIHTMALEFLKSERDTYFAQMRAASPGLVNDADVERLLEHADLTNPIDNQQRLRLLYVMRCRYIGEIPPDTQWYDVNTLTDDDVPNLYVTRHPAWTDPADSNELALVANRKNESAKAPPDEWNRVMLWAHEKAGPFTIIEGNHSLVGYVASKSSGLNIPVLVGLSPTPCYWHPFDAPAIIWLTSWAETCSTTPGAGTDIIPNCKVGQSGGTRRAHVIARQTNPSPR